MFNQSSLISKPVILTEIWWCSFLWIILTLINYREHLPIEISIILRSIIPTHSRVRQIGFRLWPEAHVTSALFPVWWHSSYSPSSRPAWSTACRIPPPNPTPPERSWPETRRHFRGKSLNQKTNGWLDTVDQSLEIKVYCGLFFNCIIIVEVLKSN